MLTCMLGILTLFAIVVICIGIDNGDFLRQVSVLKKEITKVQTSSLNDTTATNVQLARYYLQIAMLYQQQDLALHTGGDLQRKALKYFNLAINSSSEFSVPLTLTNGIQINPLIIMVPAYYQRGMLLKMMGDGQGALESYLHVLNLFAQHPTLHAPYEKSLVYSSMADAYLLQGDLVKTIKNYYQALSITPCKTEYWYGLVNTIKEYLYTYKQPAHTHTYNSNADTRTQIQTQISAEQIQQQVHSVYMRLAQYMLLAAKLCHKQYVLVDNDSVQVVREAGDASSYRNMTISPYLALAHESFMYYYYLVYGPSHTHTSLMDLDSHINIYTEEEVMSFAYTTDIQEYAVHTSLPAMTYVYDDINQYRYATKESDMYYALSYVYDAMRMHTQAYTYIQYANRVEEELRRSRYGVQYDPTDQELSYNNSASIFTEQFYVGVQVDPQSSDGISSIQVDISNDITVSGKVKVTIEPIFIVGMMRSGSTLLESMLDSHSLFIGIGEESLFNAHLKGFRDKLVSASRSSGGGSISDDVNDGSMNMLNERRRIQKEMQQEIYSYRRRLTKLAYEKIKSQVHEVWSKQGSLEGGLKVFIVDKMLFNYRNIGFIQLVYPESPILHIYRDPLDTLYSIYKHKFDEFSLVWSLKWRHILNEYKLYIKHIHHFSSVLGNERITHIRYEDLVRKPESCMSDVLEKKLGVTFEDSVLEYYSMPRPVQTHSQSQVRQKLYQSSIGSWRKYSSQLEPVIKLLRKDLAKLKKEGALGFDHDMKMNWKVEYNHPDYVSESK